MTASHVLSTILASLLLIVLGIVLMIIFQHKRNQDPMTPYALVKGKFRVYNFKRVLTRRVKKGTYFKQLELMADLWNTCPCANLPQIIKRNQDGVPLDNELSVLGHKFSWLASSLKTLSGPALSSAQEEMLHILRLIEFRGNIVARQELAKHNDLQILKINKS
jgi:hypothetical protein